MNIIFFKVNSILSVSCSTCFWIHISNDLKCIQLHGGKSSTPCNGPDSKEVQGRVSYVGIFVGDEIGVLVSNQNGQKNFGSIFVP